MESAGSSPRSFAALVQQVKKTRSIASSASAGGRTPPPPMPQSHLQPPNPSSLQQQQPAVASSGSGSGYMHISHGSQQHHQPLRQQQQQQQYAYQPQQQPQQQHYRPVGTLGPPPPPAPQPPMYPVVEYATEPTSILTPVGSGSLADTDPYASQDPLMTTQTGFGGGGGGQHAFPPFVSDPSPHHRSPLAAYISDDENGVSGGTPPTPTPISMQQGSSADGGGVMLNIPGHMGLGLNPVSPLYTPNHMQFASGDGSSIGTGETDITPDNVNGSQNGTQSQQQQQLPAGEDTPGNAKMRDNALYDASLAGVLDDVKVLLRHGANPNARGGFYNNPLQAAAHLGRMEIVVALLRAGADVNAKGGHYGTAMIAAAFGGYVDTVRILCNWAADPNIQVEYYGNALIAACVTANEDIANILLRYGSDVNAVGGFYGTALQAASRFGSKELVESLLMRGADVSIVAGHFGNAIRAAAFNENHREIVQLLSRYGAGKYPRMRSRNVQTDTGLGVGGHVGDALVLAAQKGQIKDLEELLVQGADPNARGSVASSFANALQAAAFGGFVDVVDLLLRHGANINSTNGHLGTPLQAAVCTLWENADVVHMLLANGADVNLKCGYFGTPLVAAAYFGHLAIIRLLVASGADMHANGGTYASPLDAAKAALNRDAENLLLHLGAGDADREDDREEVYDDPNSNNNGMISYMVARKDVPKPQEPSVDYTTAAALAQVYKIQANSPGTASPAPGEVKGAVRNYPAAAAALAQHEAQMYRSQSSSLKGSPLLSQGESPNILQYTPPVPARTSSLQVPGAKPKSNKSKPAPKATVEEASSSDEYGISPVPSNVTAIPASYTPVSMPPADEMNRLSTDTNAQRRSSRPTPTPSAHLEPSTIYSVTSAGEALEELIATEENWQDILELLPEDLQSGLSFKINLGNPVWTSLSSSHSTPLPLFIANAPVVTPLLPAAPGSVISVPPPATSTAGAGLGIQLAPPAEPSAPATTFDAIAGDRIETPQQPQQPQQPRAHPPPQQTIPDPLPFQLDPSKPFTPEIIHRFFNTFTHATGFYALFDGNLQVLQPTSVKQLYESQPKMFGGMRVSYHATTPDFNSAAVGNVKNWGKKLMGAKVRFRDGKSGGQQPHTIGGQPYEKQQSVPPPAPAPVTVTAPAPAPAPAQAQQPIPPMAKASGGEGGGGGGLAVPEQSRMPTKSPATGITQGTANIRCSSRVLVKGQKGRSDVECRVGVRVRVRDTSVDRTKKKRFSLLGNSSSQTIEHDTGGGSHSDGETYLTTASHAVFDAADVQTVIRPKPMPMSNSRSSSRNSHGSSDKPKRRISLKWKDGLNILKKHSSSSSTSAATHPPTSSSISAPLMVKQPVVKDVHVFTRYGRRKIAGNLMIPLGEVTRITPFHTNDDHDVAFIRPDPLANVDGVVCPAKGFYDSTADVAFGRQLYFICYDDDDGHNLEADEEGEEGEGVKVPAISIGQAVFRSGWKSDAWSNTSGEGGANVKRCVLYRIYPPPFENISLKAWSGVAVIVRGREGGEGDEVLGFHSFRHKREEGNGYGGHYQTEEEEDEEEVLESDMYAEYGGGVKVAKAEVVARSNVFGAVVVPSAWLAEGAGIAIL